MYWDLLKVDLFLRQMYLGGFNLKKEITPAKNPNSRSGIVG